MPVPASGSGCQRVGESKQTQANSPLTGSKRARKEESGRPYVCRPASDSGCQRVDESEQRKANSSATGSKRARKDESGRPYVRGTGSGSGCQIVDASEQTQLNSSPTGSKEARKEESERPGVSGASAGRGCHTACSEEAQANVDASDGQCPVEYIIVDSPDDSPVNKTAAHGRSSLTLSPVINDLYERQDIHFPLHCKREKMTPAVLKQTLLALCLHVSIVNREEGLEGWQTSKAFALIRL